MDLIKIPKVEGVVLLDRTPNRASKQVCGTLYVTSSHTIFVEPEGKKEIWISHMHVGSVDKLSSISLGHPIKIRGKNFMNVVFVLPRDTDCSDFINSLSLLSKPAKLEDLYAFTYRLSDTAAQPHSWDFFDIQSEYLRQGVPNENWVLSTINQDYQLCSTYPGLLFVPITSSTPMLISSSKFRSKGRLPVLAYLHRFNQAVICRCSQPLVGFNARCEEDESLFQCIGRTNPQSKHIYVIDTRPKINALANRATGKGYESESAYQNVKFQFFNIENIHVMRSSLNKLLEVIESSTSSVSSYLSGLESSGWLRHIKAIIDTAVFVAKTVEANTSVVVHCSDGWDRTSQVTSLASLLLDPHYRTIEGFQTLIEKDWLCFGHKFVDRCGFLGSTDSKEVSPIFTQLLDCTWQLTQQFPSSFQFNEKYLLTIHDHLYSNQFGTFLGNSVRDRERMRLRDRTYCLWGYLSKYTRDFSNPFYDPHSPINQPVIMPVTNPQAIKLWRGLYCRFEHGTHPQENLDDVIRLLNNHHESLSNHKAFLQKRIAGLHRLLGYEGGDDDDDDAVQKQLKQLSSSESMDFQSFLKENNNNKSSNNSSNNNITNNNSSNNNNNTNSNNNEININITNQNGYNDIETQKEASRATNATNDTSTDTNKNNGTHKETLTDTGKDTHIHAERENKIPTNIETQRTSGTKTDTQTNIHTENHTNRQTDNNTDKETERVVGVDELLRELRSVGMVMKGGRGVEACSCAMPFEQHSSKNHCWSCGNIFCTRCIDRYTVLPGHLKGAKKAPVCKDCFKLICSSPQPSVDDFQKLIENV